MLDGWLSDCWLSDSHCSSGGTVVVWCVWCGEQWVAVHADSPHRHMLTALVACFGSLVAKTNNI